MYLHIHPQIWQLPTCPWNLKSNVYAPALPPKLLSGSQKELDHKTGEHNLKSNFILWMPQDALREELMVMR